MVSGGQVNSDASVLSTVGSNFTSQIEGLASSWKGASYDSISSQAPQVVSEFFDAVKAQMESFASACDLYLEYANTKAVYETAVSNYNKATANNDSGAIGNYATQMNQAKDKMEKLKKEILSALSSCSSTKLTAESVSTQEFSAGTTAAAGGSSSAVVQSAIDWAMAVAADDSHGYSQQTRWGNPNYDCSSLVISAYEAAGTSVKDAGATYTGNMRSAFTQSGFEWIPGQPDMSTLQPGDVLLDEENHTEMYIGNGMNVGAHDDWDGGDGDSSGTEINVSEYSNHHWDGVLRYVGYDNTQQNNS